jgi:hypothetical protein
VLPPNLGVITSFYNKEVVSMSPSLSRKYANFSSWIVFIKISAICSSVEIYWRATSLLWTCYPRYLGITRRSCLEAHMVLDMEYREQERPEHGPGGPIFFFSASFVLSALPASITTGLVLHQRGLLLHEVIGPRYHGMCHI